MSDDLAKGCGRTLGHGETCCEGYLCSGCRTLADRDAQIERLTAQLAEARQAERAAVVVYARREHEAIRDFRAVVRNLDEFANAIEAGEHLA